MPVKPVKRTSAPLPQVPEPPARQADRADSMYALVQELYPICRSITGDGVRQSLEILARHVPLSITELPTGTEVLDWTVPKEWNIRAAWIQTLSGERVIDFARSNLHVVNYSTPVRQRISRAQLDGHLHSLPAHPDWIPYRTSYYAETWGFCLSDRQRQTLTDPEYEVCIDATLEPGHLTYGEAVVAGQSDEEILLTAHICHPSLCNDNLSGIAVATWLVKELQQLAEQAPQRYTLRVLFIPGTIGSIAWLAQNRERAQRIRHGLSLVCLGDERPFTYKRTLHGKREIDRVMAYALAATQQPHQLIDYFPYGYDERQFNSPGFGLPVGSLMRGQHGKFPEYHTSADDLSFVTPERLQEALALCRNTVGILNDNLRYQNNKPFGEPQLGKRGVYRALGGGNIADPQLALFWLLALSDGQHDLLQIAERAALPFAVIRDAARLLEQHELLTAVSSGSYGSGRGSSGG
jgi:aminopeptidase-like protein